MITDQDIRDLMAEAGAAGDDETSRITMTALGYLEGDAGTARAECERIIETAKEI